MKPRVNLLAQTLKRVLTKAQGQAVPVETLLQELKGKGQAVLLIFCSLPFCQPIMLPGFSTPFGILLAFTGIRIAFGHRMWLPKFILKKKVPYHSLEKIARLAISITDKLRFFISTRLVALVQNPFLHMIHGVCIAILGLILALPLPIPFSNMVAAYPLLVFGLAFLEDDGAAILVAYVLSAVCFFLLGLLVWVGKGTLTALLT